MAVTQAQGNTLVAVQGFGIEVAADDGNVINGPVVTREHVIGVRRNTQVVRQHNMAFGPDAGIFQPCHLMRGLIDDKLNLKEDANGYMRSNLQLADAKRFAGALGEDRAGWTISTCTSVLPGLMPNGQVEGCGEGSSRMVQNVSASSTGSGRKSFGRGCC